jgi:hypothetical protein
VTNSTQLPGTYRESDGSPVTFSTAVRAWQAAARQTLESVAHHYHGVITYKALAEAVQNSTGIRTRMLLANWIGRVLGAVSADCHRLDEPMLSALCVYADGGVGPGYAEAVIERYGGPAPEDLDRHSAEERLRCYRHFGAPLPPDGGVPALTPQVAARRRRARHTASPKRLCSTCNMQLPLSGQCDFCT